MGNVCINNTSLWTLIPYLLLYALWLAVWESVCCIFSCEPRGKLTLPWTPCHRSIMAVWMCLFVSHKAAERNRKYNREWFQRRADLCFSYFVSPFPPVFMLCFLRLHRKKDTHTHTEMPCVRVSPVKGVSHIRNTMVWVYFSDFS